jgi:hypothetical protein
MPLPANLDRVTLAPEQIGVFVDDWRVSPQPSVETRGAA